MEDRNGKRDKLALLAGLNVPKTTISGVIGQIVSQEVSQEYSPSRLVERMVVIEDALDIIPPIGVKPTTNGTLNILAIGASITKGFMEKIDQIEAGFTAKGVKVKVFQRAVGGSKIASTVANLPAQLVEVTQRTGTSALVICHTAGNDVTSAWQGYPEARDEIMAGLADIMAQCKAAGAHVVMSPISYRIPPESNPTFEYNDNDIIPFITDETPWWIESTTSRPKLDLWTKTFENQHWLSDGIHPDDAGDTILDDDVVDIVYDNVNFTQPDSTYITDAVIRFGSNTHLVNFMTEMDNVVYQANVGFAVHNVDGSLVTGATVTIDDGYFNSTSGHQPDLNTELTIYNSDINRHQVSADTLTTVSLDGALDPTGVYTVKLTASRKDTTTGTYVGSYTVAGVTKTLNAETELTAGNVPEVLEWTGVTAADVVGGLLEFEPDSATSSTGAYLCGISVTRTGDIAPSTQDYDNVVVIGGTQVESSFGRSLTVSNSVVNTMYDNVGLSVSTYGYGFTGTDTAGLLTAVQAAMAAFSGTKTLYVIHAGEEDMDANNDYGTADPTELAAFEAALDALYAEVAPIIDDVVFADPIYRHYSAETLHDTDLGVASYLTNVFHPRLPPLHTTSDSRSLVNLYTFIRNSYDTYLEAGGIVLTSSGMAAVRQFVVDRTVALVEGTAQPAPVPDTVPVPLDGYTYVVQFCVAGDANDDGFNGLAIESTQIGDGYSGVALDDSGAVLAGKTVEISYLDQDGVTPIVGMSSTTNGVVLTNDYDGTLISNPLQESSCYGSGANKFELILGGFTPASSVLVEFAATRVTADGRMTEIYEVGNETNADEYSVGITSDASVPASITVTADENGYARVGFTNGSLGSFFYLGGLGVAQL